MLHLLRTLTPKPLLAAYHLALAELAMWWYGNPSRRLTVIGVTGTYGKSSVVMLLGHVLRATGHRVGWVSTATISDGTREWLNAMKMTTPGRFFLQRFLRQLLANRCTYAIVETTSQGIAQYRHRGISYDVAVLTNLSPEHLEAHGGFERYRAAKAQLFRHTARGRKATRIAVIPADLEHPEEFTQHHFSGRKSGAGFTRVVTFDPTGQGCAPQHLGGFAPVLTAFLGNVVVVLTVCEALGIDHAAAMRALATVRGLPGRLEQIECGQPFDVIVDYAFTPDAIEAVYRALGPTNGRTIHVLGGTGGGRDRWKYPVIGKIAAQHADVVIVTNEDPYDDDPMEIIREVARGAREWIVAASRGTLGEVREILDRRDAIAAAVGLAQPGDRILVTGKGCEQAIVGRHGAKIPWDDRVVLRELLIHQSTNNH
ncbi:UDP-N-acetylmuramyl-tripeptide synthetase [Candidatus Uhrbacteria bacterium]|nr:UDP-N-acetylmuramyl-tripeptide synthetase [Candidatus Uhrbacteria bacterium]